MKAWLKGGLIGGTIIFVFTLTIIMFLSTDSTATVEGRSYGTLFWIFMGFMIGFVIGTLIGSVVDIVKNLRDKKQGIIKPKVYWKKGMIIGIIISSLVIFIALLPFTSCLTGFCKTGDMTFLLLYLPFIWIILTIFLGLIGAIIGLIVGKIKSNKK